MKKEIRICGFGGQGVILAGFIIGKAASVYMDYQAVQSQSYGPEARGGAARSEVIISDEKIGYPRPLSVDCLVAMSQESFDSYRDDIRDDTIIILDPDLVTKHDIGRPIYKIHGQQIAQDLGNKIVTNIVMVRPLASIYYVGSV
jgi:2-oxoglutarate ferredoxin oxidoreductase subunit gamma